MTNKAPDESSSRQYLSKRRFFDKYVDFIRTVIEQGKGISLSEIRDIINSEENIELYNNEIKTFMEDTFGEDIQLCSSERKNQSLFVFSSKISIKDILNKLQSLDTTKAVATKLRESLLSVDFNLNNKFCDAEELRELWQTTKMPDE